MSLRWLTGVTLVVGAGPYLLAADAWHTDLFVGGSEAWYARVPLDVANGTGRDLAGFPVSVGVGQEPGKVELVGAEARAVRVCDARGVEMLFDLRAPSGERLEAGPVPAGAELVVPVSAAAGGTQRLFAYWDNPEAYFLPEYLQAQFDVVNPGFEQGTGPLPAGWRLGGADGQHTASWVTDWPHGGARCVQVQVPPGVPAAWVTVQQRDVAVYPGARYRLTAWVRGEGVAGQAGWYVHVATPDNAQALNRVEKAGDGTFDWREARIEFTAPSDAVSLSHGTVLYGTGVAWFDDVALECLDAPAAGLRVTVGATERLVLDRDGADAPLTDGDGRPVRHHAPIHLLNVGPELTQALACVPAAPFRARLQRHFGPDSLRIVDSSASRRLPHIMVGDDLLFQANVPARCRKTVQACLDDRSAATGHGALTWEGLVGSGANLVQNASFEQGDAVPDGWLRMGEELESPVAAMARVARDGDGKHCARLTLAPGQPRTWTGWQQNVPVQPDADYLFLARVRTEGIADGAVRIHAHLYDRANEQRLQIWGAGPDLQGTTDWTLLGGRLHTTAQTETVRLYLTMNALGTVYHDDVFFGRVVAGKMGEWEHAPTPGAPKLAVWTENALTKVFGDDAPQPPPRRLELSASRGEAEGLQVCLRATEALGGVTVSVDPLRVGEAALPAPAIERVGYVPCLQPSGFFRSDAPAWQRRKPSGATRNDGWEGWWPDYLVPLAGPLDLEARRTQPLLVTFRVPRETRPGLYRSVLRVASPEGEVQVPLTLRVGRFVLPERPTLQVLFDLRNGPGWSLYDTPEKVEAWWRFMAAHRISADHILPEPTFSLQDGHVRLDADAFDRAAALYFDELHMAVAYFPSVFYSFGWGHSPGPFLGLRFPSPEHRQAYQEAVRLFWDHVREKGWADRFVLYLSDEPDYHRPQVVEDLAQAIRLVREVDPSIPVYSSTWGHVPEWDGVLNHWGIGQYGVFPLAALETRRKAGDKVWFTTDGQFELDTPYCAAERLLPYYCFAHQVSGYEFWALPWYTYDPVKFGWYAYLFHSFSPDNTSYDRYPNGSGHMAYPGESVGLEGPLSSLRLEQVREGIEDYERLIALERLAEAHPELRARIEPILAEARALVPIPNAGGYRSTDILPDPGAVDRVRSRTSALLEDLGAF